MESRTTRTEYDKRETCRNCKGYGTLASGEKCPVCLGSGLVDKHYDVRITVKPFVKNDHSR
ncbi:MAG: hypothetical protein MJ009_00645 [Paludibacteraceae bacterium]|nr:hypothetical protein [Paludibacteraceae bacterium]